MTSVPSGIEFALQWPRLDQGGLKHVEEYLKTHPNVRLVVVDTWAKISPQPQSRQRSQYEGDYEALTPLKYLADTYRVSVLAVHHLRKMGADDVLDEITGSIGVTGAVDGALILKRERGQGEATLFVTGRDVEHEQQFALMFDSITAMWTLVGNAEEFKRTKERQEVIDLLSEQLPDGMSPRQIAEALDKNYHTTRSLLRKMEDAGEVRHSNNLYFAMPGDIARNQRNQSVPSVRQPDTVEPVEKDSLSSIDYGDYTDYADDSTSSETLSMHEPAPSLVDAALQHASMSAGPLKETEDVQQYQDHRDAVVISVINRNQRNQLEVTSPRVVHRVGSTEGDPALGATNGSSDTERIDTSAMSKTRCPHHLHARWVRFDPSGQAWCDRMDCWDCYRLMKIGEALGYQQLLEHISGPINIGQGIEAWASFVASQGSFAILTATRQAIAFCEALRVEVPDLSGEVQCLVPAW